MKHNIIPILLCLTLMACASNTIHQENIATATVELGEVHLNQGNFTAALKEFLDAEKVLHNDPYLHNDIGIAYMGKERFAMAEEHFKRAIAIKPDYIPAKNNLGTAYLKQEKYDKAIECYKLFSEDLLYSTPHFAFSNMGWAYLGKRDYGLAQDYFLKALGLQPDFVNAIHGLATSYIQSGNAQKSEIILKRAIAKRPRASILHADLARTYEALSLFDKARESWKLVNLLAPEATPLALEARSKLGR